MTMSVSGNIIRTRNLKEKISRSAKTQEKNQGGDSTDSQGWPCVKCDSGILENDWALQCDLCFAINAWGWLDQCLGMT